MRLTAQDASFLYTETASGPMHGTVVAVLEGEVAFPDLFKHIETRVHLIPRYRERLAFVPFNLAHAKWVPDPDFKLENHVKQCKLGEGSTIEDGVEKALELGETLLNRSRPLWMTYVIEGVPGHTLMVSMAHHAMIDGVSGVDLSMILMDLEPDAPTPPPPEKPWEPGPMPGPLELVTEALTENLVALVETAISGTRQPDRERDELMRRGTEVMTRLMTQPVFQAPFNAAVVGPKRKVSWTKRPFSEFREIRRAFGGTINDAVLTVVTESAARYLKHHGEPVENQQLRLMVPVSVRREGEAGTLGNRVSAMYPVVPASPLDVTERLRLVREETERIKANKEPQALELLLESAPPVAPVAMAQTLLVGTPFDPTVLAARSPLPAPPRFGPRLPLYGFNFTCTNVPGVQVAQYIAGHKVVDTIGAMMLSGTLGYGVAVGSYNQEMFFSFTSDPRLLPDIERMRDGVDAAFQELLNEARSRNAAAAC